MAWWIACGFGQRLTTSNDGRCYISSIDGSTCSALQDLISVHDKVSTVDCLVHFVVYLDQSQWRFSTGVQAGCPHVCHLSVSA